MPEGDATPGPAGMSVSVGPVVTLASKPGDYNAFGGITRCANGDLLAGWRRAASHSPGGPVILRRSTDNGATWGPEYRPLDAYATTYGTVTFSTLSDGRVVLASWLRAAPEVTRIHYSTDHGATFGATATINHGFTYRAVIEGPVIEAPNGDLLVAIWGYDIGEPFNRTSVKVVRSTDGGATFDHPITIAAGVPYNRYWNESGLYLLPSGELHLVIREETAPTQLWISKSRDGGFTWSAPAGMHGALIADKWIGAPKTTRLESLDVCAWLARKESDADAAHLIVTRGVHYRSALIDPGNMMYGQVVDLGSGNVGVLVCVEISSTQTDARFYPVAVTLT